MGGEWEGGKKEDGGEEDGDGGEVKKKKWRKEGEGMEERV